MRKIMLVIDEYKELVAAENLLRRLGFDVLSLGKEVLLNDALLRFHPDIVIASFKGRAVDGLKVTARVKKLTPPPRVALSYVAGNAPSLNTEQQAQIDALMIVPVQPANLIKIVAQMSNLDPGPLLGKFQKLTSNPLPEAADGSEIEGLPSDLQILKGGNQPTVVTHVKAKPGVPEAVEDPWAREQIDWTPRAAPGKAATARSERSDRYDSFLIDNEVSVEQTLSREKVAAAGRQLKRDSEGEKDALDRIDEEKRQFVKAMFKGGKDDE
jgi:CheY-like chemotaxis protein